MSTYQPSPKRRFHIGRFVALIALALVATACTLNQSPEGVTVGGGVPVVRLASPVTNATYLEGVPVNIQASVTNAGEDIDRVEVSVDNAVVTTLPQPNASGAAIFSVAHTWPAAGAGSHLIGVTAFRADGSASEPATVTITIISPAPVVEATQPPTPEPSDAPTDEGDEAPEGDEDAPADEGEGGDEGDEGDEEPADDDSGAPTATFTQGVNVRRGPSTNFNPPIGSFAANQTAEIVGINPAGDWYKVRYYNSDGWVFASLMTTSGDLSDLPVDPGPPTPVPATSTPVPPPAPVATAVPVSQANLVAGDVRLDPGQPTCGETFNVRVDLANLGSTDTTTSGRFTVEDTAGGNTTRTEGSIPVIAAGQTVNSGNVPITVSTNYDEEHTLVVILNPSGSIPETGSGDNRREVKYTLQRGDC